MCLHRLQAVTAQQDMPGASNGSNYSLQPIASLLAFSFDELLRYFLYKEKTVPKLERLYINFNY
jgi:hypothetical protein